MIYQTVDMHTAGEPLRIIVSGVPPIPGGTMLEKREYFRMNLDHIRRHLMHEPRGHNDMYGCVMTPPVNPGSDLGVLFMHNEGFSTMCGHGVIALVTYLVKNKLVKDASNVTLDTPAGVVRARFEGGAVAIENVPSFVFKKDLPKVVFGGAFYVLADAPVPIDGEHLEELRALGMQMKLSVERTHDVVHPLEPGLRGIYGTIFTGRPMGKDSTIRNVTVFADAEVDRSPCGTGTCGILASRFADGLLKEGEAIVNESIIGTIFKGRVISQTRVGSYDAVIPEVSGSAHITGYHTFIVDPDDPVAAGFRIV